MSKKRANKSKRRRESQRPQASNASSPAKEPRLKLIPGGADDAASGIRAAAPDTTHESESLESSESSTSSEPPPPVSEPPASVEDLEEEARFFHEGRIQTPHAFTVADDLEVEAAKPSPKMTPVARARRAHFSKYVKGAMVAATAVLTLAGIRVMVGRSDRSPDAYVTASVAAAPPAVAAPVVPAVPEKAAEPAPTATVGTTSAQIPAPVAEAPKAEAPAPVAAEPAKAEAPKVEAPPAEAPKAEAPKAEAPKAEAPKADAPKADAPAAVDPAAGGKTAAQEKADARRLLERGKSAAAIEAGERSVALDPADGEAWLILGAAYQDKGNLKDARRAFQACTKQGKRGPISECRAMLQQ